MKEYTFYGRTYGELTLKITIDTNDPYSIYLELRKLFPNMDIDYEQTD